MTSAFDLKITCLTNTSFDHFLNSISARTWFLPQCLLCRITALTSFPTLRSFCHSELIRDWAYLDDEGISLVSFVSSFSRNSISKGVHPHRTNADSCVITLCCPIRPCRISVLFHPRNAGTRSATVVVACGEWFFAAETTTLNGGRNGNHEKRAYEKRNVI